LQRKVKGVAIRGLLRSIKERGWPVSEIVARLPEAAQASYQRSIVASVWYPYPALTGLIDTLERLHGQGEFTLTRQFGDRAAERDLGTTFKIITAIASLDFFLKRAQIFWSQYCNGGHFVLERVTKNSYVLCLEEFPDVHPGHCALIEGWLEGMGRAVGAEEHRSREIRCVHRGDPRCEFNSSWTRLGGLFG
jgi:hypothetical protein